MEYIKILGIPNFMKQKQLKSNELIIASFKQIIKLWKKQNSILQLLNCIDNLC